MRMLRLLLKPTGHMFPGDVPGTVHRDRVVTGMFVQPLGAAATRPGRRTVAAHAAAGHRPHQEIGSRRRRRRQTPAGAVRRVGGREDVRLKRHVRPGHRPLKTAAAAAADPTQASGAVDRRCVTVRAAVGRLITAGRIAPLRRVVTLLGGRGPAGRRELPGVVGVRGRLTAAIGGDWRTTELIRRRRRRHLMRRRRRLHQMLMVPYVGRLRVPGQVVRAAVVQRHRGDGRRRVIVVIQQRRHWPCSDPAAVGRRRRQQRVVAAAGGRHRGALSSSDAELSRRPTCPYGRRRHADFERLQHAEQTVLVAKLPLQLYTSNTRIASMQRVSRK